MNDFAQNIAVIVVVGLCVSYVGWQLVQAFRGRKSKLGSCCAKGCEASSLNSPITKPAPVQFLPLASLGRQIRK